MKEKLIKGMQILVFIPFLFTSIVTKAQQNFDTLVDYNNYGEFPYSIYQMEDSGYIFITSGDQSSTQTYFIEFGKLNKNGSVAFQKTFGFLGYQCYVGLSNSLKSTFDGGWIFGGGTQSSSVINNGMLVKYNSIGDTQFVKIIGDTSSDLFYDCMQTSDSGFVLVGDRAKHSPGFNNDFWIVKTDSLGNVLWERTLGSNNKNEQAEHVIENSKNQIVVSGGKETTSPIYYPYIAIYDLQGNLITTESFAQGAFNCTSIGIWRYDQYDYIAKGCLDTVINVNDAQYPEYVGRLDSSFNFKWRVIYNASELKDIYIMKEISDGGIIIVGFKEDSMIGYNPVGWIAKVDSSGNKLWEHSYIHSTFYNYFSDFQETFDHGFIVCGTTWNVNTNNQDSWIVKLDSNGCLDSSCIINTGTHELVVSGLEFAVFPNPASQIITVTVSGDTGTLILFDLLGHEVMRRNTEREKQITLDISSLKKSIYLLRFATEKRIFTAKVVKE